MTRPDLKATIAELRAAGVAIKTSKRDTEATLQSKINDAMKELVSPAMVAAIGKIDPTKVLDAATGQPTCHALYIDLRDPSCASCKDAPSCMRSFLVNLQGDFSAFDHAVDEITTDDLATTITPAVVAAVTKAAKAPKAPRTTRIKYDPDRVLFMMILDENPTKPSADAHSTIGLIMDDARSTMTMRDLREIVSTEWDLTGTSDDEFTTDWIAGLRTVGLIKFEADLLDEERAALVEAGVI